MLSEFVVVTEFGGNFSFISFQANNYITRGNKNIKLYTLLFLNYIQS